MEGASLSDAAPRTLPPAASPAALRPLPEQAPPPPRPTDRLVLVVIVALVALVTAAVALLVVRRLVADPSSVSRVEPAVADVYAQLGYQRMGEAGTGIVLTPSGEVLTNNHVVAGATELSVTVVGNRRTYPATVVGYDIAADIAVLQLQGASRLQTALLGRSSSLAVGDDVTAIGNVGGTGGTPARAKGTVTGLDRPVDAIDQTSGTTEHLSGLIATTAAVDAGDSGSPLVTTSGRVVGVDTAGAGGLLVQSGGTRGYAIPIDQASALGAQIEAGVASPGVHVGPTAFLGVELSSSPSATGAVVTTVYTGTPAATLGLDSGDLIVSLNGQPVGSPTALTSLTQDLRPGDTVTVGWVDLSGSSQTGAVQLIPGPPA
jgi:S1-C subfamily serine protease